MQKVTQHIVRLLTDHNCVIVPGFGGFVANYQSAKVHPTSFIFNSPSKSVAFNSRLTTNDGLLADTIAREERITHVQAEDMIASFVGTINNTLIEHKPVKLAGIGRLTMDIENNIQFLPDNAQNLLTESYGLYSFTAQPVMREHAPEVKPLRPVVTVKQKKKRTLVDKLLPYAAVLLLAMMTMQIFVATSMNGFDYAEIFGMNKIFTKKNFILEKYEPAKFDINPSITYFRITDPEPIDTLSPQQENISAPPAVLNMPVATTGTKYVLVAGSLITDAEVQTVLNTIAQLGYTGFMKPWGKYKLAAIEIPDSIKPADYRKAFIEKTGIADAWVTKSQ